MKIRDKYVKGGFGLLFFFMLAVFGLVSAQPAVSLQTTPQAWFGGLNAAHFATLDIDGDGLEDYIAFDRVGSRVRCFGHDWEWRRGAEHNLPPLRAWVQTHDYNGDGQKDIFTFNGISGIAVYRNDSGKFHKVTDGLEAEMFGQKTPLYCTSEDYPVIADIDGDGDLDVLNFWVPSSGDFLLYYRNFAKEEWGRADTFLLRVEDWSWGCFVESEESNVIYLDSCSARNNAALASALATKAGDFPARKHAGSTLWAFKNPQTELFDLVLGDVGFPDLYYLQNGGTAQKARMVSYDTFFPRTVPVRLHDFPILSQVYVRDTLCYLYSPYQSNPFKTEGGWSVWRYADTGGGALYGKLVQKDFLQGAMIDVGVGAYPVIYDIDSDGLPDLLIGNYRGTESATLTLYRNTGVFGAPVFEKADDDFLRLSQYALTALHPAFADMDGDGKDEMVVGTESGALWLFRLTGEGTALVAELLDDDFLRAGLRGFSAPAFADVNGDGRPDLVVGSRNGRLAYFENVGASGAKSGVLPHFELRSDSWGGVDVTDRDFSNFGYARPSFG
ncbi:MAG: VCBS repeat-containing protein, partial [Bacteroidales bacterium]|nr:VCBS repeat-containing protein [Bacteroidales bacterium]